MHWHERLPLRWEAEQRIARQVLKAAKTGVREDGVAFVEGVFEVVSEHGHIFESVTMRIEYPHSFPDGGQTPDVVLLSHRDRWRATADAHIWSDWRLCLFVAGETPVDFRQEDSLNALFGVLRTYLSKQSVYQRHLAREGLGGDRAIWPGEARSHGTTGVAEAVSAMGVVGRNQRCPCGSGRKFKHCCMTKIRR